MNVGFINQNISPRVNMGLAYVMTAAAQQHSIFFWDAVIQGDGFDRYLRAEVAWARPRLIGFSVNSFTFRSAARWARLLKELFPEISLLFGGVHPSILPDECLAHPFVDMICIGEGESAIQEVLSALARGRPPEGVAGIWYKQPGGSVVKNPLRPFLPEIDRLPFPDWDIWDIDVYIRNGGLIRNSLNVIASRGCIHHCRFCTVPVQRRQIPGNFYRVRSPENVVAEIQRNLSLYGSRGFEYVVYSDPLFGAEEEQFTGLLDLYEREGLSRTLPWICETRPELVTAAWARRARQSGCLAASLGLEAADPVARNDVLGKGVSEQALADSAANLRAAGIPAILYFMLCSPQETPRSVLRTLRLALHWQAIKTYFLYYLPLPGTPLYEDTSAARIRHRDSQFDDGYWNRPNIRLPSFGRFGYAALELVLAGVKALLFARNGWRLRRWRFIRDTLAYLLGRGRRLSWENPYALNDLYQQTVLKYFLEDHARRIVARADPFAPSAQKEILSA